MKFLTIQEINSQLNLVDGEGEEALLSFYGEAAEEFVQGDVGLPLVIGEAAENEQQVNQSLKLAMLLLVGHWFLNREASSNERVYHAPLAYYNLIGGYRHNV